MLNLKACQSIINKHLNAINLPGLPRNLYDPIRYMLELEAKRLRPSMVLMACNIFTDDITGAIYPALAVEVFHNFTLVHDDIMDNSALRRNNSTVHVKWSPDIAILSGDAMLIKAYELLSHKSVQDLEKILPVFNQTALQVCEGQQFDMDYENRHDVTIAEYLQMVEYKTAVLLAAALKIGALSGGAGESEADLLYEFGRNIGIAFQLQDDLLDVFADAAVFGKVTGNDIVSNKKTILLVEALNTKNENEKNNLLEWIGRKDFDRDDKIQAIQQIYLSLQLKEMVTQRIQHYHMLAVEQLNILPVASEKKKGLRKFSEYLMNRKK
jgi:geranylgeranyl diphosphate synthase, type II